MVKKAKFTEKELKYNLEWSDKDKHGKVFITNDIFQMLAEDKELNEVQSFHHAYAYCYLVLVSYLYRNAKYNKMIEENYSKEALREIIGLSRTYLKFNYVTKKNGVLDRLGLTMEDNIKNAPIHYEWNSGVLEFFNQEQYNEAFTHELQVEEGKGLAKKSPNGTYKLPVSGLYDLDGEYGCGTFHGFIENTHEADMEVFIKCMTNPELGATAFYLYSFLTWKCNVAGGSIEISGEKILRDTGMKHNSKEKALKSLKKFGLIDCTPAEYFIGAGKGDGASVYVTKSAKNYVSSGRTVATRKVRTKEDLEYIESMKNDIDKLWED